LTTARREITGRRLLSRADVLVRLNIGETTLYWLERTGKLKAIRIGRRVLFGPAEVERLATHGASLTEAEKEAAAKRDPKATACRAASQLGRRARARESTHRNASPPTG
jgi:hypothetical protein